MRLTSVNRGKIEPIDAKSGRSGIFKRPLSGSVLITAEGLTGDVIVDTDNHGGPDQAIMIMGQGDYDFWSSKLDRELAPGFFGENLLIDGLSSESICVGDRIEIGTVVLEVTSPRIPCVTLGVRMNDPGFPKEFLKHAHPGFYARVLMPGEIMPGQDVQLIPFMPARIGVVDILHWYAKGSVQADGQRFLAAPVHYKMRKELQGT